jgi:hypothetical protein
MQQDLIIQAVHPVVAVFLLELFLLEVEHLEAEVEHLEAEAEHLEVEALEVLETMVLAEEVLIDQDYHPLVVILETILFLKNNTRKKLVSSRLALPMHFCWGVFSSSLPLCSGDSYRGFISKLVRLVAAGLHSYDSICCQ